MIEKIKVSETFRWIVSSFLVSGLMIITYLIFSIYFETNDDSGMMYIVAGYRTNTPEIGTVYCNIIWDCFLSFWYRMFPELPWYTIIFVFVLFFSNVLILKSALRITVYRKLKIWVGVIGFLLWWLVYINYAVVFLQFTTLSTIAGTASVALVTASFAGESKRTRVLDLSLAAVMLFLSYIIRAKAGYVTVCWCLIAAAVKLYTTEKRTKQMLIGLGGIYIVSAVMIFSALAIHNNYYSGAEWAEFRSYSAQRGRYMDYPHLDYDSSEKVYEQAGWSRELYEVVQKWFFMDRSISEESFRMINDAYIDHSQNSVKLRNAFTYWKSLLINDVKIQSELGFLFIVGISLSIICRKEKYSKILWIMGSFIVLAGTLLYLTFEGRVIFRVFQLCVIPPSCFFVLQFLLSCNEHIFSGFRKSAGVVLAVLLLLMVQNLGAIYEQASNGVWETSIENKETLEHYFLNNSNSLYIYDNTISWLCDPLTVFHEQKPTNYFFWGGASMFSPLYYKQLKQQGRAELYSDVLFEDHVYLVSKSDGSFLLPYLETTYNCNVNIRIIDHVNDCNIIELRRLQN